MTREKFYFLSVNHALSLAELVINSHYLGGNKQQNQSLVPACLLALAEVALVIY